MPYNNRIVTCFMLYVVYYVQLLIYLYVSFNLGLLIVAEYQCLYVEINIILFVYYIQIAIELSSIN